MSQAAHTDAGHEAKACQRLRREQTRASSPTLADAGALTAIVVTHNSAGHLPPLARALARGTVVPARMLVVDNASRDHTARVALAEGFELVQTGSNDGFGAACNAGLRAAASEFVLLCNPDVRPAPEAVELLLRALEREPRAAVAGAALAREPDARRFSTLTASIAGFLPASLHRLLGSTARARPLAGVRAGVMVDYAEAAFILCRTEAVRAVGAFDERFFLYHEEEDLCRRLRAHGWLTLLVPAARAQHAASSSSEGVPEGTMTAFRLHSLYWYLRRYHSRPYAELARLLLAACVLLDRGCRRILKRKQVYRAGTATAPYRSTQALRRAHGLQAEGPRA